MSNSYLKLKMQADRTLAMNIEQAVVEVGRTIADTARNVQSGAQRASWYASCLVDDYKNVCQQLTTEDTRMLLAVRQVYQRDDVVLDMVELFFRKELKKISPQGQQSIGYSISEKLASHASDKASKKALSFLIAKVITSSHRFKQSYVNMINKSSMTAVNVLSFYGKMQTAAMAARRLQFDDPTYYNELYNQKIELLYYIIEPEMSKVIRLIKSGSSNEEEIIYLMNKMLAQ
ncbi:hypothetical protein HQN64_09345 [Enterobacteriaceae bacterium BIT-l23]|uniref:hypothetical protein n=1 Tax=Jejubacter sp. L23 TaxID=3092086 RepID=UPI001584B779|nr:hypothetical protein [Enterobacteriaceae bacterium BIT-l23]